MNVAVLLMVLLVAACSGDVVDRGRQLAEELPAAFPGRIAAASFDTDDNIVFIDVVAMAPQAELGLLCDEIRPKLTTGISASTSYRWHLQDCPS